MSPQRLTPFQVNASTAPSADLRTTLQGSRFAESTLSLVVALMATTVTYPTPHRTSVSLHARISFAVSVLSPTVVMPTFVSIQGPKSARRLQSLATATKAYAASSGTFLSAQTMLRMVNVRTVHASCRMWIVLGSSGNKLARMWSWTLTAP